MTRRSNDRLFEVVKGSVVAAIRSGEFGVGAVVPPVEALAKRERCSIGTVRRALTELAHAGLLKRVQGRGTVVLKRPAAGRVCLLLSHDMHTNLLFQHPVYAALVHAGYQVEVLPLPSLAPSDIDHLCVRCDQLSRGAGRADCLVAINPHFWEMAPGEWQRYCEVALRFPRRVYYSLDARPRIADTPLITGDQQQAARDVVAHLVGLGHRRIAVTAGIRGRGDGWAGESADSCGHLAQVAGASIVRHVIDDQIEGAVRLLTSGAATAFWAVTDHYASLLMQRCHAAGLSIPADVSLIGRNDTPWGSDCHPPLTTVSLDPPAVSAAIVAELDRQASRPLAGEPTVERIPMPLVVRASTGPVSVRA